MYNFGWTCATKVGFIFKLFTFVSMTVKDYLLTKNEAVSLAYLAKKMWPNNDSAKSYLWNKLSGKRPWTNKDEEEAKKHLKALGIELTNL